MALVNGWTFAWSVMVRKVETQWSRLLERTGAENWLAKILQGDETCRILGSREAGEELVNGDTGQEVIGGDMVRRPAGKQRGG